MPGLPECLWTALVALATAVGDGEFIPVGDVVGVKIAPDRVDLQITDGPVAQLQMLDAGVVRIRFDPSGEFTGLPSPATEPRGLIAPGSTIVDAGEAIWMLTDRMGIQIQKSPFRVTVLHADGSIMTADAEPAIAWNPATGVTLALKQAPGDEAYLGLGQRGGPIDRRGRVITMRNTDEYAYGEFTDPHYQSFPYYWGVRDGKAYGVFLDRPERSFFDFDSEGGDIVLFGTEAGGLDYYVIAGPDPPTITNLYGRLTGYSPLPPLWTLGYHHSRYGWQSADEILQIANGFRAGRFPCDALWFDLDYMDRLHHFTWSPVGFPDPEGLHDRLEALSFERVYINEPCVVTGDPLWPELDALGYFLRDADGRSIVNRIFLGEVSWLDFSRPDVAGWYRQQLGSFMTRGVTALWNDLNEPAANDMPEAFYDFDGEPRSDLEARNIYALLENRMAWEAQRELRPGVRPWNMSRSGFSGIQRYAHTWSGDTLSTFDSLRVSIQMSVSMGLSGHAHFSHDTGGFLGSPSPELYIRWLEFSSLTPLLRTHSVNTADPREPWLFEEPYSSMIRERIEERYRLLPYLYTLFEETSRTGRPIVAPTMFYAPSDPATLEQDTEFMLGPDVLVAPVFEEGAESRRVYLPQGNAWIDTGTDDLHAGGETVEVAAPLGTIPLFVREGAIIVRGPVLQHVRAPEDLNIEMEMEVDVYPGPPSSFTLYEDDGRTFEHIDGACLRTQLRSERDPVGWSVSIARRSAGYRPPRRSWLIRFHGVPERPLDVIVNGASRPAMLSPRSMGWTYRADEATVVVRVTDRVTPIEVVLLMVPGFGIPIDPEERAGVPSLRP